MSKGNRVVNSDEAMTNEQLKTALTTVVFKASKAKGARWGMRLFIAPFDEDGNVLASWEYRERGKLDNVNKIPNETWILFEEYSRKMIGELSETTKDMFYSAIRRTPRNEGAKNDNDQTPRGSDLNHHGIASAQQLLLQICYQSFTFFQTSALMV
ncbi:hypothetical protein Droror1_Dr00026825 [Drosera rotundifolia]